MYTQFFQLKQSPFSIAPDPRYLYMSERHREALAHLLYGVGSGGGFVLLTGEIGAGKTTVCRCFMEQIPANCELGYIFNPRLSVEELLQSVCEEFRIAMPDGAASVKAYIDAINRHLLASHAAGRNNVLVIDEAQNLSAPVLEQLRLLTNLETSERKLLQIILIGQPELRAMLAHPELEQLAQRVIARYHLGSLSVEETGSYIAHRLAVAGAHGDPIPAALAPAIHRLTGGVPRRINLLCDRALLGAYVENAHTVTRPILRRAAAEVFAPADAPASARHGWRYAAAGVLAGVVLSGAAAWQLLPKAHVQASRPGAQAESGQVGGGAGRPGGMAGGQANAAANGGVTGGQANAAMNGSVAGGLVSTVSGRGAAVSNAGAVAEQAGAATGNDVAVATAQDDAMLRQLAGLWGQQVPDGDFCAGAARVNLRCLRGKGGLEELLRLDRPAMLKLADAAGPRTVLLTGFDGRNAILRSASGTQTITADALAVRFDGTYTTLWRAPRAWRDEVQEGDRGPDVDWLARRLADINGTRKPRDNRPLDGASVRLLKAFQQAQGLKADGVAGPKTMIRLQQLAGVQEPRLGRAAPAVAGK